MYVCNTMYSIMYVCTCVTLCIVVCMYVRTCVTLCIVVCMYVRV